MDEPFFSLILAIKDFSYLTALTLESYNQHIDIPYEVIIIHQSLSQRDIKVFKDICPKIYEVKISKAKTLAAMLNEGITLAKGKYINFAVPGDSFLADFSLKKIYDEIQKNQEPDFLCSPFLLRDGRSPPEIASRSFSYEYLARGKVTSKIHGCFYERNLLKDLQGFNSSYNYREILDILCKIYLAKKYRTVFIPYIVVDYEYTRRTTQEIFLYGWETTLVLYRNFGLLKALSWFFFQDHLHMVKLFFKSMQYFFSRGK